MSILFSDARLAVPRESYKFWRGKGAPHMQACALLGCEAGETGFIWKKDSEGKPYTPKGDHGEASGVFQWHEARASAILKRSGYDVRNGTHLDMLNGAFAEMTGAWSPYRHVWASLLSAKTLWSATNELVKNYEQSASQGSDDIKRSALALYFDHVFSGAAA